MGKSLISQRRGKGSLTFIATNRRSTAGYIPIDEVQKARILRGTVVELIKDSGRNAVLAKIIFENGAEELAIAPEGLFEGQDVYYGKDASIETGNVLPLNAIPEGCPVFNIEMQPGDGGKMVKGSGVYALLVSKTNKIAKVKLPSGGSIDLNPGSRATIGCSAGGGREEKPFIKAGNRFHLMKSKRHYYPIVRGVAMNASDHPFGGSQHHPGKSKSTSRRAPPGRKVGAIGSRRTGRKKK